MAIEVGIPDDNDELSSLPEPDAVSDLYLWAPPTLMPMSSEMRPGLDILSSTSASPVSMLTTVDMVGRDFGMSWVQSRPILRNLQTSSMSKSPFNDVSTASASSLLS